MISGIVWYGIAHHKFNTDAAGHKIRLIVNEQKYLEQGDLNGGLC